MASDSLDAADLPGDRDAYRSKQAVSFFDISQMPTRYNAVFVSPHLDDAVFSCGAELARLVRQGPVLVLNLFTKYAEQRKVRAIVIGPERYEEERAAAVFLEYTSHNFDEPDAVVRRAAYRSVGNLFRPPVAEDVDAYLPKLRKRVFDFLEGLDYERLYVPMAIGWHVDHVLAHQIFEPWAQRPELLYYEDAPYCLFPHATLYRLRELGDFSPEPGDGTLASAGRFAEWRQTATANAGSALIGNLRPRFIRPFAAMVVGVYLFRLMSLHRKAPVRARQRLIAESRLRLDEDALRHKVRAIMLYRSQFKEFFRDVDECVSTYKAYSRRIDAKPAALERYWKLSSRA